MAELFGESGQTSNLALSPPNLRGIFLPAIDNPYMADGLGLVTPWGSGGTARKYKEYGPASAGSSNETQLRDLSSYFLPSGGDGLSYNFEGPAGPTGPPGPPGPAGLPGTAFGLYAPTGMLALDDTLEQIAALGTDVDQMIYTSAFEYTYTWTVKGPTEGPGALQPTDVDCDSDMSNIVVSQYLRKVWKSTDYGDNWTDITPPGEVNARHSKVASSSDGSSLALAIGNNRPFYTSVDGGVNWTARHPKPGSPPLSENWWSAAMDSDGSFMVAGESIGRLFTSADSGVNWTERQPAGAVNVTWNIACDNDGSHIIALTSTNPTKIYVSVNSGVSWTAPTVSNAVSWEAAACSSDGAVMVAVGQADGIYVSSDFGETWTRRLPVGAGNRQWFSVDVSSNGKIILVGGRINGVTLTAVVSFDGGVTWQIETVSSANTFFYGAALTDDGSRGVLTRSTIGATQFIFTSVSYGQATWAETTITAFARTLVDDATAAEARTTLGLGTGDSPTFTGLTLSGLTATRLAQTNGSKALASVADLTTWVAGTTNEINVADDGDGTITIGIVDPLIVAKGGSGAATLTDHAILLGSGTDAFTALGAATDGQLPIGSTGLDPVLAALTGTANRVTVTNGAGSIILSGPQDYDTGASPTFAGLDLTGITDGYVPYISASGFADGPIYTDGIGVGIGSTLDEYVAVDPNGNNLNIITTGDTFASSSIGRTGGITKTNVRWSWFIGSTGHFFIRDSTDHNPPTGVNYDSLIIEKSTPDNTLYLKNSGRVGIGTTTPATTLQVIGTITAVDLSLSTPSLVYNLNHDSFTGFVTNEHIDHSAVSITAGTGMSGGGDITASRTLNCTITQYTDEMVDDRVATLIQNGTGLSWTYDDVLNTLTGNVSITQYTDEMAQDAVGTILTDSSSVDFTYDDALNTITAAVLPAGVDHDALLNFAAGEHFVQTAITNVSTGLATGLLKVTTGTGALSVITDSSTNWDAAYTHVSSTGADHGYINQSVTTAASPVFAGLDLTGITDGRVPYISASGFADGSIYTNGTTVGIGAASTGGVLYLFSGNAIMLHLDQADSGGNLLKYTNTTDTAGWFVGMSGSEKFGISRTADIDSGAGEFTILQTGSIGLGELAPVTVLEITNLTPFFTIHNSTHTDAPGARSSRIIARGEQSGGEETILGYEEFSHNGALDDEKGQWRLYLNDGNDGTSPTLRLSIDSVGTVTTTSSLFLTEQAADLADVAGQGQIWVKNTIPNELWFTDDVGTASRLGFAGHLLIPTIKSGATQVGAGAAATELWKTSGHATLPDNVIMIGV